MREQKLHERSVSECSFERTRVASYVPRTSLKVGTAGVAASDMAVCVAETVVEREKGGGNCERENLTELG